MTLQQLIQKMAVKPKTLFLLDGMGALLSAFLLGIILVKFQPFFGIPLETLYILATLPCFFALFDFVCFFVLKKRIAPFLVIIGLLNVFYTFTSIVFAVLHNQEITAFGWAYISVEICILILLITIELKTAALLKAEIK